MAQNWYFRNQDKSWGPFSTPESNNLAAAGLLQADDLLWPEEGDCRQALSASAALNFLALERVGVPAPDWLEDVKEDFGPRPPEWAQGGPPDWLADVAGWEALSHPAVKPLPDPNQI